MFDRSHWHKRNSHSNLGWKGPKIADGQGGKRHNAQDFRFHKPQAKDSLAPSAYSSSTLRKYG